MSLLLAIRELIVILSFFQSPNAFNALGAQMLLSPFREGACGV